MFWSDTAQQLDARSGAAVADAVYRSAYRRLR